MEPISTLADIVTVVNLLKPFLQRTWASFPWGQKVSDGIVARTQLASPRRLPGEVFAAELLSEPVRVEAPHGGHSLRVVIDRRNVDHAVISTAGKRHLCDAFVAPKVDDLISLDKSVHALMRSSLTGRQESVVLPPMPFRWGSGGILSVVSIRGRRHIPMFFRDIRPAGWNIPLGSTERMIDHDSRVKSDFDHELCSPSLCILREFLEETLVLDRDPTHSAPKRFEFCMPYDLAAAQRHVAGHLEDNHRRLRDKYDHMEIQDDRDLTIRPSLLALPMDLTIHSNDGDTHVSNVLVTINCLELGIEVVKVIEYDIPAEVEPYFLDGEILMSKPSSPELVRMPVALFPLELLREFMGGEISLAFEKSAQAALEISRRLDRREVILFDWDIERRNAIASDPTKGVGSESERYMRWRQTFGGDFADNHIPSRFTPATVKTLNLLLSANIV